MEVMDNEYRGWCIPYQRLLSPVLAHYITLHKPAILDDDWEDNGQKNLDIN